MPFFVRLVRVGQAAAFGFLAGTFLLIAANYSDVHSYIDSKFMNGSRAVAEEVSKRVDGGITRSKQALAVQDAEIGNLTRSIQDMRSNEVKRSIGRKANAPPTAPNPHLDALERRLAETIPMRDKLAAALSRQEEGRNAAIEKGINDSPNAVRKRTGLAAQLEAISALTAEHPTLLLPIALALEILSLVLELGPMWAAATKLPSALAARLARDHFVEVTEIATEGAERLGLRKTEDREIAEPVNEQAAAAVTKPTLPGTARPGTSDSFPAAPSRLNGASAARRGRGRPRKNDADQTAKESHHA
jgi:hypothetical protein